MSPDDRTLRWLLRPIERWLTDERTTDFCINGPRHAFVRQGGVWTMVDTPYDLEDLHDLGKHSAGFRRRDIGKSQPICGTASPWGHRVHIIQQPCVLPGLYSFTARRPPSWEPTTDALKAKGVYDLSKARKPVKSRLLEEATRLKRRGDVLDLLAFGARNGLNMGAAGIMGAAKTTVMRAAFREAPDSVRVASIEDEQEARLRQPNRAELLYTDEEGQSEAQVGAKDLMKSLLRMAVEQVFIQEIRDGRAAQAFLRLAATLPTVTTDHGDSCHGFFETIRLQIKTDPIGAHMSDEDIFATLNNVMDVVVHCYRDRETNEYGVDDVWVRGVDPPMEVRRADVERQAEEEAA